MKKILFLVCCLSGVNIWAQSPQYFVELYFEDAKGFRDTLLVGRHEEACDSTLNEAIGEKLISSVFPEALPFGVIGTKMMQTRLQGDDHTYKPLFSNRIFFHAGTKGLENEIRCGSFHDAVVLKCRLTSFPLKIKWKENQVNTESSFCNNPSDFRDQPGAIVDVRCPSYFGLYAQDSILFQAGDLQKWPGLDKDYVLIFILSRVTVDVNNPSVSLPILQVYPNPSNGHIRLLTNGTIKRGMLHYFNATGSLLKTQALEDIELDVSDLPTGLIQGVLYADGRAQGQFRFVKVE